MSLYNNPYCQVDAQEYDYQNDVNEEAEQTIIYELIGCYYDMWDQIDINLIVENTETVTYEEVKTQAERFKKLHKSATIIY